MEVAVVVAVVVVIYMLASLKRGEWASLIIW